MDLKNLDFKKLYVELDDVHSWDYPDFCDAYISYAEYDGVELTVEQTEELEDLHPEIAQERALEKFI